MGARAVSWVDWDVDQFYDLAFSHGINIDEADLPEDYEGIFVRQKRIIVLASGLCDYQIRCVLPHELIHCEYSDEFCNGYGDVDSKAECRTARLTARRLIDSRRYAAVERMYNTTSVHFLACQLDVTEKVIRDYQRFVLGS
jgi:hypothetical protein